MKKLVLLASVFLLAGCNLAQRQMWQEAEKKAEVESKQCKARHQSGELDYGGLADCSDSKIVPILEAAHHPSASYIAKANAFRRLLGKQVASGEMTEIDAAMADLKFVGLMQEQAAQMEAADRAAAQQSNQALHELGLELMRQGAAPQRNTMNCSTTFYGNTADTNCH